MKKTNYIFASLLFIALAILLLGCSNTPHAHSTEPTIICEHPIETEEAMFETSNVEPAIIETQPEPDENVSFDISYVDDGEAMPYALLAPSSANADTSIPLIVWLHGMDEQNLPEDSFLKTGLTEIIMNWELDYFNAYIICPQMKGNYYADSWSNPKAEENLAILLDKFISEHNVDLDKIIVSGSSLGGQGAIYMAVEMADYFDRAVVFSGYGSTAKCSDIEIPVLGYLGTREKNEYIIKFMKCSFAPEENCLFKTLATSRFELPTVAFNLDEDENGMSDIVEWMLSD